MKSRLEELRAGPEESRSSHGWRLTKTAGWLLRSGGGPVVLAALVAATLAAQLVLNVYFDGYAPVFSDGRVWLRHLLVDSGFLFLVTYLLVALALAVDAAVDGLPSSAVEAIREARACLGAVLGWTLISIGLWFGAWLLTSAIGAPGLVLLLALPWYCATFFVVPVLGVEQLGPLAALGESTRLLRRHWRESLAAFAGITLVSSVGFLGAGTVLRHASAIHQEGHGNGRSTQIIGVVILALVAAAALVTKEAVVTFLVRVDLGDLPGRPYAARPLDTGIKALRVVGAVILAIAVTTAFFALFKDDGKVLRESNAPGTNYEISAADPGAVTIDSGAPVIYEGREIGTVLGSQLAGGRLEVSIHVDPGIGPGTAPGVWQVVDGGSAGPFLELLPSTRPGPSGAQTL